MNENRTTYPKKKVEMYQQLQELPKKYNVLAIVNLEKVRASQLLPLRKKLGNDVQIFSIKNKVAKKALQKLDVKGIEKIIEQLKGQCVFFFTNMSPFKLNVLLGKNKVMLEARGGDIASMDVVVEPKNTGIAPGPMLTEFKENGIPTKIDQGTIWIMKETTPVKKGEVISEKLAGLLGKLDIKIIDIEKFRAELIQSHQQAISLSIEAVYVTPDNIEQLLSKASQSARSLSTESGFMTDDTKDAILQKADSHAKGLAGKAKDYNPS